MNEGKKTKKKEATNVEKIRTAPQYISIKIDLLYILISRNIRFPYCRVKSQLTAVSGTSTKRNSRPAR